MQNLLPDNLAAILKGRSILLYRLVSKGLKSQIERFPEFTIILSPDGTQNVSCGFLASFKGRVAIRSKYGWNPRSGWFDSMAIAIQLGLIVTKIETLEVDCCTLPLLSDRLAFVWAERKRTEESVGRIEHVRINLDATLSGLSKCAAALEALHSIIDTASIKLVFKSNGRAESMQKAFSCFDLIPRFCTIEELTFW